jgi:hypothetical protein
MEHDELISMSGKISARSKMRLWKPVELEDNIAMQHLETEIMHILGRQNLETGPTVNFMLVSNQHLASRPDQD